MGVYISYARLPSEYQEVEYIQSSNTQYINTGILNQWTSLNLNMKFIITQTNSGGEDGIFGAKGSQTTASPTVFLYNGSPKYLMTWFGSGTGVQITTSALSLNTQHSLDITFTTTNRTWILDGTSGSSSLSVSGGANNTNGYMTLFADGSTPASKSYMKLYSAKITVNGTLQRDFVPCYRKSDSVIGLYDLVNNQFYTNSGSGTFSKGNDVTMAELKNAYIGEYTGWEYSYDFRNKSSTILTNDGWSILKGTPVFDSNGISCSGANTAIAKNIGNSAFANANKITMEYNFKLNSSSDTGFLICQTATSSSTVGNTGLYATSGSNLRQTSIFGTSTNISGMGSGTYKGKITLDLVGKTYTAEMTGKTTQTGTLTDTQISNIRNNIQVIRVSATNTSNTGIQDIYLCVE